VADWLFDRSGRARIIEDDYSSCFRSSQGTVIGRISGSNVYSLRGSHLGWYEGGVLDDGRNRAIAFKHDATGWLPSHPGLSGVPGMPVFSGVPGRPGFSGVPGRPGYGGWSDTSLEEFFG
jgi:4-fold beta flower protein